MTIQTKILFLDDDPMVLQGLKRALHRRSDIWEMRFVSAPDAAFAEMQREPAEVVVSDLRMPGMDGVQFLDRIAALWPGTVRIILSGQTDR